MTRDHTLHTRLRLPVSRERVFAFFAAAENLGRITPPEVGFSIQTPLPIVMAEGTLIDYTIRLHGLPMRWRTRIARWVPGEEFIDVQLRGPYAVWEHRHTFRDDDAGGTIVEDTVRYRLPLGWLGQSAEPWVRQDVSGIFRFRVKLVQKLFQQAPSDR